MASEKIKAGDEATLALARHLFGLRVKVIRQSKTTGTFTVRLLESNPDAPAYTVGTELHVHGYELRAL